MLHVRDCPGTTINGDLCPFPWCRKVKRLLYHLLSCGKPNECRICRPRSMPKNLIKLAKINFFQKQQARKRAQAAPTIKGTTDSKCEVDSNGKKITSAKPSVVVSNVKSKMIASNAKQKDKEKDTSKEEKQSSSSLQVVPEQVISSQIILATKKKESAVKMDSSTKHNSTLGGGSVEKGKLSIPKSMTPNTEGSSKSSNDSNSSLTIVTSSASSAVDSDNGGDANLDSDKTTTKVSKEVFAG